MPTQYTFLTKYCKEMKLPRPETKQFLVENNWFTDDYVITDYGASLGIVYVTTVHGTKTIHIPVEKLNEFVLPNKDKILSLRNRVDVTNTDHIYANIPITPVNLDTLKFKNFKVLDLTAISEYDENNNKIRNIVEATILNPDGTEYFHSLFPKFISDFPAWFLSDTGIKVNQFENTSKYDFYKFIDALDSDTTYICISKQSILDCIHSSANAFDYNSDIIDKIELVDLYDISKPLLMLKRNSLKHVASTLNVKCEEFKRTSFEALTILQCLDEMNKILSNVRNLPPKLDISDSKRRVNVLDCINNNIISIPAIMQKHDYWTQTVEECIIDLVAMGHVNAQLYIDLQTERQILSVIHKKENWNGESFPIPGISTFQFKLTANDPKSRVFLTKKLLNI